MHSPLLTVFTAVTPSYRYSAELQLGFKMVRAAFPAARWLVYEPSTEVTSREFVLQHLPLQGNVVFLREPAMLVGRGVYQKLEQLLQLNTGYRIAMPSDIRGYHPAYPADYLTLRGFESFSAGLCAAGPRTMPYDNRQPLLYVLRAESLTTEDIADDPFDLPRHCPTDQVAIAGDAYIHPFLNYYHESRADIVHFVPHDIRSLLDIGCSRGGFGGAVKAARGCRVAGVEMNVHEALAAAKVLDQLWVGDLLTLEIAERFDCISCLDVLEHFVEPQQVLEKIKQLLNPGGQVLLSVPNVGHWSVVTDLLAGRWDYVPAGILCNTHMRFYTRSSLEQLLADNGLTPVRIEAQSIPPPESVRSAIAAYRQCAMEVDDENLAALQFIVVAKVG